MCIGMSIPTGCPIGLYVKGCSMGYVYMRLFYGRGRRPGSDGNMIGHAPCDIQPPKGRPETLYHRDDALSTKPVMHYQGTA